MNIVDLHVHSNKSDGTYSPTELVDYATLKGLSAFALTDHDTIDGLSEAIAYADSLRKSVLNHENTTIPEVIPGIEFSTEHDGKDIHIVGLYIDYKNPIFIEKLQAFIDSRIERNHKMCAKLQEIGFDITYAKLVEEFPGAVITRAHYGKYLLNHGYIKSIKEAFDRYIGDNCPYYVPREKVTPKQAIELILLADGIPVLAHPVLYHMGKDKLDALVGELAAAGLQAIECVYSTHTPSDERDMKALAKKYNLLPSGGSDFHGSNKPGLDLAVGYGKLFVHDEILSDLQKCRKKVLFSDMDGTLLKDDSTISPAMLKGLELFIAKGNHLVLTSGRPLPAILEVMEKENIARESALVISYNGALIYDCSSDLPIIQHRLTIEDVLYISREAERFGIYMHTFSEDSIITRARTKELEFYTKRIHLPVTVTTDFSKSLSQGPYKIQCICLDDHEKLVAFRTHIASYCEGKISAIFSNDKYLELLSVNAGKGNAVHSVCKHLHIPLIHAYAVGDEENDISMLQMAGHGIAMANGSDAIKRVAEMVTENDNNHDGVLEIMNKFF